MNRVISELTDQLCDFLLLLCGLVVTFGLIAVVVALMVLLLRYILQSI